MKLLELFAGSRSVGKQAELLGWEVFSTDLLPFDNIDLVKDIRDVLPSDIPFIPDVIWASPPCTFFSVASIGKHWTPNHEPKTETQGLKDAYTKSMIPEELIKEILDNIKEF